MGLGFVSESVSVKRIFLSARNEESIFDHINFGMSLNLEMSSN